MKATAVAPANIAFIKYWGKKDEVLRLPSNGSVSMNLSNLLTTTTVEFLPDIKKDTVIINGKQEIKRSDRVIKHLDKIRKLSHLNYKAKVVSQNNFPVSVGLSSSASAFAALTVAAACAAGLKLTERKLSILARQGSGSACRSIPDGFVEWLDGETNETSFALSIYPYDYWDIVDVVVIVSTEEKSTSSTEGQRLAWSSPFYKVRLEKIKDKVTLIKELIKEKNFIKFGELIEGEALELHTIMLTSTPSLIYIFPSTLYVMNLIRKWREERLLAYFTLNTGQEIHLICQKKDLNKLLEKLQSIKEIKKLIVNNPSIGTRLTNNHLF